jgi:hypothetical protein
MKTKIDLLKLINALKKEELKDRYHSYTRKQLSWYCNPNNVFHRYRNFEIPKKSGGMRKISAPESPNYMNLLRYVSIILQSVYEPSMHTMGFVPGKSIADNAKAHMGMNYVFNIDLKDFFPSFEVFRIAARLQVRPFYFTKEVARHIAGLCTMRIEAENSTPEEKRYRYVLPQGSPASPVITNLMCEKLDFLLSGVAKRFGLIYTRYADDITFSSLHNVYQEGSNFRKELERIITEQGFTINLKKMRLNVVGFRQEVTGLTISKDKINVTRKYIKDLRGLFYIWEKYGYSAAMSRFLPKYKAEKGHVKKGNPDLTNVLDGKLMYLKMVKGETDSVYVRLHHKFKKLVSQDSSFEKTNSFGITYIETMPLLRFEKENNTNVAIRPQEGCKRNATFKLGGIKQVASIKKDVSFDTEQQKEKLAISNCRDSHGKQFWLIHLADIVTVSKPHPIDIDKLNNDLDILLCI